MQMDVYVQKHLTSSNLNSQEIRQELHMYQSSETIMLTAWMDVQVVPHIPHYKAKTEKVIVFNCW